MAQNDYICFDGEVTAADTPVATATTRGLMYGEGVFDTLRTYENKTHYFDRHFQRTRGGLEALGITMPQHITIARLKNDLRELLKEKQLASTDAIVRMQFWRDGQRGYNPEPDGKVHYAITASRCPQNFDLPVLCTVSHRRIASESMPSQYKFTNGINYILAAREAAQKGADDALMQTVGNFISETTIANIFWRKGSQVFTPSTDCDLLPGITRNIVMELIKQHHKLKLTTGRFNVDHILRADSVWICNSVRELLAVRSINEKQYITDDDLVDELRKQFYRHREEHLEHL